MNRFYVSNGKQMSTSYNLHSITSSSLIYRCGLLLVATLFLLSVGTNVAAEGAECSVPKALALIPPKVDGEPVKVSVGIFLLDLIEIDEIKQSFKVDYTVDVQWHDPRMNTKALGRSLVGCHLTLDDIWDPKLQAINPRDYSKIFLNEINVNEDGIVDYYLRIQTIYSSTFKLHEFPFDQQVLKMHLASFQYGPEDVVFQVDDVHTGRLDSLNIPGWTFISNISDASTPALLAIGEKFSHLFHYITLNRKAGYYIWKFVVPLCFIVLMAGSVFWLDPTNFAPQIGISTASVFTLVAFLLGLRQGLPQVAYLTRMDELILSATILVFMSFAEVVFVSRLAHKGRADLARRIDFHARWIYLVVFAVLAYIIIAAPYFA